MIFFQMNLKPHLKVFQIKKGFKKVKNVYSKTQQKKMMRKIVINKTILNLLSLGNLIQESIMMIYKVQNIFSTFQQIMNIKVLHKKS